MHGKLAAKHVRTVQVFARQLIKATFIFCPIPFNFKWKFLKNQQQKLTHKTETKKQKEMTSFTKNSDGPFMSCEVDYALFA